MPQEISISYQAVKSKVYRLIDAMVEGSKTESEVRESMRRWWMLIHPADRPVAEKYLAMVLSRSNATLGAIGDGLFAVRDYKPLRAHDSEKVSKITASPTQFSRPFLRRLPIRLFSLLRLLSPVLTGLFFQYARGE